MFESGEHDPYNGQAPAVKLLSESLVRQLSAGGADSYGELLLAEYGHPDQVIEHHDVVNGRLSVIRFPARPGRPEWITHLIYAGLTEAQVREHLVSLGLGSVEISPVYPPTAAPTLEGGARVDDPYDE